MRSCAHIIDLEQIQTLEEQLKMKTAECELQNRTLVEQLKMRTAECEQHAAQRCRLAERTTELTNLEATRWLQLFNHASRLTHEKQATDTLPELHGAVPAIERVDLEAPVVFTRQLAQADRVQPSGLSQPIS